MKLKAKDHIDNSIDRLEHVLHEIRELIDTMDGNSLNTQEGTNKWSILQCLKHLTIADSIYVVNIKKAFAKYPQKPEDIYSSHWKGDYFAKMIAPKPDGQLKNNMKTMKSMNPELALDAKATIEEFFSIHNEFVGLMKQSQNYSLNKVKVATALGPIVKLRLGDAYNFLISHTERHLIQVKRIKKAVA